MSLPPSAHGVPAPTGHVRWGICALLFFSVAVNYIDRLVIGILKGPMSERLGWSETDYGHIAAAFSFAYAFGYLFGGRLMDRWGVKKGLPIFVFSWSVAATAHGLCGLIDPAAHFGFQYPWFSWAERGLIWATFAAPLTVYGFMAARIALGLTEGGNFPGAIKTVAEWFPVRERALATGWFNAGTNVGAVICPLLVKWMYDLWGWEITFYATGLTGFVWVAVWYWLYETPEKHPRLSAAELAYIKEGSPPVVEERRVHVPWLSLLRYRAVWAYVLASIFAGPAWGFYQFFLPDFLRKTFGLSLTAMSWWTSAFYFLAAIGGVTGGWLAGKLLARGWTVNAARKTAMLACALAVVPVFFAPFAPSAWVAVLIVGLAGSAHQGWSANQYSIVSDTMPREAISSVVGLGGFVAYFTGGFVNEFTGQILQKTGSYIPVFAYFSLMYLLSLLLVHLLVPRIGGTESAATRFSALSTPTKAPSSAQISAPAWQPDCGDGHYRNPVLHADYSDPDAVRVGADFYLVSSSFTSVPGLPLLHSHDLVNWRLINHALPALVPRDHFAVPRHGQGVWAPSIRHHAGKFWIYYPDPDFGLYVITADDPAGKWNEPVLVKAGKGLIDPCPLWDDDGQVYLVHGWAKSRAGIKNRLTLLRLSADGASVEEDLGVIVDGTQVPVPGFDTLEGPKFYKRDGWYYIFAPAGGVATGWQSVFRAKNARGPYEHRIVLAQGATDVNGPHQGALVDTPSGEWWFLHFQDKGAYGRIVHLQPVVWRDGWPVIGHDPDGDGTGEPVSIHRKPLALPGAATAVPATSDEFNSSQLGLQWQWQANPGPGWHSLTERPDCLRLHCQPEPKPGNLYRAPYLLLQKFPALVFTATARLEFHPQAAGEQAGLMVFGYDYAWIGLRSGAGGNAVVFASRREAAADAPQDVQILLDHVTGPVWLRVTVETGARCRFAFSTDGHGFTEAGQEFTATCGHWVGAKLGLFASTPATIGQRGCADFDWFRVQAVPAPLP